MGTAVWSCGEAGALGTPLVLQRPSPRDSASPVGSLAAQETVHKEQKPPWREDGFCSSGGGIRTRDLRVMSPTSYLAAPPRVACEKHSNGAPTVNRGRRSE